MKRLIYVAVLLFCMAAFIPGAGQVSARSAFAPQVPAGASYGTVWAQLNPDGFGSAANIIIESLAGYNGLLYAGTHTDSGAQIWRRQADGWHPVVANGFNDTYNVGIDSLLEFNGFLYASTENYTSDTTSEGGQIWRSSTDGASWLRVVNNGSGTLTADPANFEFFRLFSLSSPNRICAATYADPSVHGAEIWCSTDGSAWTKVISNGFGKSSNAGIQSTAVFNGKLYFGTNTYGEGGEVWRTDNDFSNPVQVSAPGFGDTANILVSSLVSYGGYLYGVTHHTNGAGLQVWRCQGCAAQSDWTKVVDNGFGSPTTRIMPGLVVFHNQLYLVSGTVVGTDPSTTLGLVVWETADGAAGTWRQLVTGGFNDTHNYSPYYGNSLAVYQDQLFIGTINLTTGAELWTLLPDKTFVPAVKK